MPRVVYLHSALHNNRVSAANPNERRTLLMFNKWDCIIGLGLAGLVNPSPCSASPQPCSTNPS
jgi:manganese transport protein